MFRITLAALLAAALLPAQENLITKKAGKYEVSVRPPAGGLFAGEEMQIEFRIVDASQVDPVMGATPVVRARIASVVDMPSMPGMPKVQEVAHPEGVPGEYGLHPSFPHGGEYRLKLNIAPPAGEEFAVEFPLAVADAPPPGKRKPGFKAFRAELLSPKSAKAGEPVELRIRVWREAIKGREGVPDRDAEVVKEFQEVHERLLHLIVVRNDLGTFAHEHPETTPVDGVFQVKYTFPSAGEYNLFVDVAPKNAGSQVLPVKLKVSGKGGERFDLSKAARGGSGSIPGLKVAVQAPADGLPSGKTLPLSATLQDDQGAPVRDLQPYLGAVGHLILIHQDGVTFVHSHPDERDPENGKNGTVAFLSRLPKPGLYRGWAQFQRGGQVQTVDFVLEAR
jgi:hypothetical protein